MCWWNLSPKGENSAPFLQELKLFNSQRIELLYRWTLGHCCCLIEYSGALCIETLYLTFLSFRSGLHNAHASSVWMWTILTSMAVQRNWLICPQTCKLLAFNPEEFLTLAYLFLCSLCFYCHLLSGQGSKTYFWESVSTCRHQQQRRVNALSRLLSSWRDNEVFWPDVQADWNHLKCFQDTASSDQNADFATEGVTSGLMVSV